MDFVAGIVIPDRIKQMTLIFVCFFRQNCEEKNVIIWSVFTSFFIIIKCFWTWIVTVNIKVRLFHVQWQNVHGWILQNTTPDQKRLPIERWKRPQSFVVQQLASDALAGLSCKVRSTPVLRCLVLPVELELCLPSFLLLTCRPIPNREFVEAYIKAYYLTESDLETWMQSHPEYSSKQLASLVSCSAASYSVASGNKKTKQKMLSLIDELTNRKWGRSHSCVRYRWINRARPRSSCFIQPFAAHGLDDQAPMIWNAEEQADQWIL